jgi:hypothetical protein
MSDFADNAKSLRSKVMKRPEHIKRAKEIGHDSWELISYMSLPSNAKPCDQIDALRHDQRWLRDHTDEICREIDQLIGDIEAEVVE